MDSHPYRGMTWSKSEQTIARRAFDAALTRELHDVMKEARQMANQIKDPAELWDLERHLTQRRKEIDQKYDSKYSRLTDVLGRLLYEHRISERDLRGLREDQLMKVRSFAEFLADGAA